MFSYSNGNIEFSCHESNEGNKLLLYDGVKLNFTQGNYFSFDDGTNIPSSGVIHNRAYDRNRDEINFEPQITIICNEIFETVKKMYSDGISERYCSILCACLYEAFAGFWKNVLLIRNQDRVGIKFWKKVLNITKQWQDQNPDVFIHTGTPYYFLSENFLLVGDLDSAFTYLHNAILIDQKSFQWEHHDHIGAYNLAKMLDYPQTQMNYFTREMRSELEEYISYFNSEFSCYSSFTLDNFTEKFLKNEDDFHYLGYFFTFTFYVIVQNKKNLELESHENYFSKMRSLDIVFNLCLIIDEILKNIFLKNELNPDKKNISYGISALSKEKIWTNSYEVMKFWKAQRIFDMNKPNQTIPMLLAKTEKFQGRIVEKEIFTLLLSHVLRNYGAHNLNKDSILVSNYDQILNELIMALFISVESIKY